MKSKEFLKSLSTLADSLRQTIEASFSGWDDDPKAIAERRAKVNDPITGFEYFVKTYFPHYLRHESQSQLHEYLFGELPKMLSKPDSQNEALAAPRGEAKSTIVTRLFPLYCVVTARKRYIVIFSDTIDQAAEFLLAIKMELEANTRLKIDFPEAFGVGSTWQVEKILTKNGIRIKAAGAGKSTRGLVYGAYRPDLAILDDLENDENVENPKQRDKLEQWIKRAVLKLGVVGEKFDVLYIGTILHYDSVLNRVLKNKGWQTRTFKALIEYPHNMPLWDEWEVIFEKDSPEAALAFYQKHKKAMDKGAKVSWSARPLYALMVIRVRDGHDNFDSELQNDPSAGEDAPFGESMNYWYELPKDVIYFGACDPSLGKKSKKGKKGDPSAIVVGAYQLSTGKVFIVEADIQRRTPDKIISDIIRHQATYRCQVWAFESVQFQEFLRTELVKRSAKARVPVPAMPIIPNSDKMLRIQALQPHMFNGLLLLHNSQSTLKEEFKHFPSSLHDDGMDATEMVWTLATNYVSDKESDAFELPEPDMFGGFGGSDFCMGFLN